MLSVYIIIEVIRVDDCSMHCYIGNMYVQVSVRCPVVTMYFYARQEYSLKNLSQSCSVSSFDDTEVTPTGRIFRRDDSEDPNIISCPSSSFVLQEIVK